ncbi:MAG TPA: zinc ribbon domain-containing protein [Thermoplasmata archaeon]|nr:zinc ribbon domain-containing protein [Thermoplasmata archaeon]
MAILRAAAYLPTASVHGRRALGPDEDGFTLAATAVERSVPPGTGPDGLRKVRVFGETGAAGPWGFGALLGAEVIVEPNAADGPAFRAALRAAVDEAEPSLVVAVDSGSIGAGPGAVAFRVGRSTETGGPAIDRGPAEGASTPLDVAFELFRSAGSPDRSVWVGDWEPNLLRLRPTSPRAEPTPVGGAAPVSEGAYVPRPRYLEGIDSRWRFLGERCATCGRVGFPARHRCRGCGRADRLEPYPLPKDGGKVEAVTWIGPGGQPTEFDGQVEASGPYGVVLVELIPGVRATLQLTDCEPGGARLGSTVVTRLRRLYPMEGEWRYGRKAIPIESAGRP